MSLSDAFRQASSSIIGTFSSEFKKCTFRSLDALSTYDTELGVYSDSFIDYQVNMAFSKISDDADVSVAYRNTHKTVYISGKDLEIRPKKGDQIIDWNGQKYIIDGEVKSDMYNALFTITVMQDNEG
jgi:hypothetical protein